RGAPVHAASRVDRRALRAHSPVARELPCSLAGLAVCAGAAKLAASRRGLDGALRRRRLSDGLRNCPRRAALARAAVAARAVALLDVVSRARLCLDGPSARRRAREPCAPCLAYRR